MFLLLSASPAKRYDLCLNTGLNGRTESSIHTRITNEKNNPIQANVFMHFNYIFSSSFFCSSTTNATLVLRFPFSVKFIKFARNLVSKYTFTYLSILWSPKSIARCDQCILLKFWNFVGFCVCFFRIHFTLIEHTNKKLWSDRILRMVNLVIEYSI